MEIDIDIYIYIYIHIYMYIYITFVTEHEALNPEPCDFPGQGSRGAATEEALGTTPALPFGDVFSFGFWA